MLSFIKFASEIFRDYETDGVPASGAHKPIKQDIRNYLSTVETALAARLATDATQDPTVAPFAWAQLTRYRVPFNSAI